MNDSRAFELLPILGLFICFATELCLHRTYQSLSHEEAAQWGIDSRTQCEVGGPVDATPRARLNGISSRSGMLESGGDTDLDRLCKDSMIRI